MRTVNRFLMGTLLAAAILVSGSGSASAQQAQCGERAKVVAYLAERYQEQPVALGLQSDGRVLEVFSSESGASWTILITTPNGIACLVSAGEAWQPVDFKAAAADLGPGA